MLRDNRRPARRQAPEQAGDGAGSELHRRRRLVRDRLHRLFPCFRPQQHHAQQRRPLPGYRGPGRHYGGGRPHNGRGRRDDSYKGKGRRLHRSFRRHSAHRQRRSPQRFQPVGGRRQHARRLPAQRRRGGKQPDDHGNRNQCVRQITHLAHPDHHFGGRGRGNPRRRVQRFHPGCRLHPQLPGENALPFSNLQPDHRRRRAGGGGRGPVRVRNRLRFHRQRCGVDHRRR